MTFFGWQIYSGVDGKCEVVNITEGTNTATGAERSPGRKLVNLTMKAWRVALKMNCCKAKQELGRAAGVQGSELCPLFGFFKIPVRKVFVLKYFLPLHWSCFCLSSLEPGSWQFLILLFVFQDKDWGGICQEPLQAVSQPPGSAGGRVSAVNRSCEMNQWMQLKKLPLRNRRQFQ